MSKLYRIVPDTISTLLTTGYLSDISEDVLYSLGYLSFRDHGTSYFGTYEDGKGMSGESSRNSIFFFYSPWSCFRCLNFFRDPYGREVARILEYDVPENIITASKGAFTNYESFQAKGKMVPIKLLQGDNETFDKFSPELRSQLETCTLHDTKSSIEGLVRSTQQSKYSTHKGDYDSFQLDSIEQRQLDPSIMKKINNRRFKESGTFFKTDIITGKSMMITRADREHIEDALCKRTSDVNLSDLIQRSNGILTLDSFERYDFDSPDHEYGMIL